MFIYIYIYKKKAAALQFQCCCFVITMVAAMAAKHCWPACYKYRSDTLALPHGLADIRPCTCKLVQPQLSSIIMGPCFPIIVGQIDSTFRRLPMCRYLHTVKKNKKMLGFVFNLVVELITVDNICFFSPTFFLFKENLKNCKNTIFYCVIKDFK